VVEKMILRDKDSTRMLIKCDCGCTGFEFMKFDWSHNTDGVTTREYYIYQTAHTFSTDQAGFFTRMRARIKMAFNILWKGTYRYNEIVLKEEDFKELITVITEFGG
jgi:hypothetical protein